MAGPLMRAPRRRLAAPLSTQITQIGTLAEVVSSPRVDRTYRRFRRVALVLMSHSV